VEEIMSKKHRGGPRPVPPGNRPQSGPPNPAGEDEEQTPDTGTEGVGFQEQDPKRRLGDFGGAGEHPIQQPGPLNDGGKKGR
jgi:hypothetical protein